MLKDLQYDEDEELENIQATIDSLYDSEDLTVDELLAGLGDYDIDEDREW